MKSKASARKSAGFASPHRLPVGISVKAIRSIMNFATFPFQMIDAGLSVGEYVDISSFLDKFHNHEKNQPKGD
ncbi:MAG: hypothetical protein AB1757_30670 [Acidobacteriota bacterium]